MELIDTAIPKVKLLEPQVFDDAHDFFMKAFRDEWFKANVCDHTFAQESHSKSGKDILHGLHYQTEDAQDKFMRVAVGEVFDVAVGMRKNSPTLGEWAGEILSAENRRQLWVPEGFTHGSYVLSDEAEFVCKCVDCYSLKAKHSLIWDDPSVGINQPLQGEPNLSPKDLVGKVSAEAVTL